MNLRTASFIWLKGVGFFLVPCMMLMPVGIIFFCFLFLISWPAIFLYGLTLWLLEKTKPAKASAVMLMLLVPTFLSVVLALGILRLFNLSDGEPASFFTWLTGSMFYVPLVCRILSVAISHKQIALCVAAQIDRSTFETP